MAGEGSKKERGRSPLSKLFPSNLIKTINAWGV
jgi:hypothetical protein